MIEPFSDAHDVKFVPAVRCATVFHYFFQAYGTHWLFFRLHLCGHYRRLYAKASWKSKVRIIFIFMCPFLAELGVYA
jgi:hypothetical protein